MTGYEPSSINSKLTRATSATSSSWWATRRQGGWRRRQIMASSCFINPEHLNSLGILAHFPGNIILLFDIYQFVDDFSLFWLYNSEIINDLNKEEPTSSLQKSKFSALTFLSTSRSLFCFLSIPTMKSLIFVISFTPV